MRHLLLLLLAGVTLPACAADAVDISQAHARASIPGQPNTAAFAVLSNHSGKTITLKELQSPAAENVELHGHTNKDGMMRMHPVKNFQLDAGESIDLQKAGMHIMLIKLKKPLAADETIAITFCFDNGCTTADFPVVSIQN